MRMRDGLMVRQDDLREALERFVAGDGPAQLRVTRAGTTVRFLVEDDEVATVTLLLDRRPAATLAGAAGAAGAAEITVRLTARQARAMARGELVLPTAVLEGKVRATGPVRKYLAVEPILRARLRNEEHQS